MDNTETNTNTTADLAARIAEQGMFVAHQFHRWPATAKLEPFMLGLSKMEVDTRHIRLGSINLLGDNQERVLEFKNIAGELSDYIIKNSLNYHDLFRFVPNNRLERVHAKCEEAIAQGNQALLRLIADFPTLRSQAREFWLNWSNTLMDKEGNLVFDTSEKVEGVVDLIMSKFPDTTLELRKKFKFGYIARAIEIPDAELRIEVREIQQQKEINEARRSFVQNEARKLAQESEEFVRSCLSELRTGLVNYVEELQGKMRDGKSTVNQKSLNKLRDRFNEIRQLNFVNDNSLNELMDRFEGDFLGTSVGEYRDSEDALDALRNGVNGLVSQARELADADVNAIVEGFGNVGRRRIQMSDEAEA